MMGLYLDSAGLDDAVAAAALGFVRGITTNPALMRKETGDPLRHLRDLLAAVDLPEVYYQPTGAYGTPGAEAEEAWSADKDRVVLKLPATPDGAALAGTLTRRGARVALTAAQTPHAMLVAESMGCAAVIPYLDRAVRDLRTDSELIRSLAGLRRGSTRVIAASVKNSGQVLHAFASGADAVTAPLPVLRELLSHPASIEAEQAFAREYASTAKG
ncbi:transaldolase [Nonomuraea thailandensis]|uniref:Transaldolase n=2 Tax=Nonomuraea thailandensis TaxID=1188745 RepID=A0A9X2GIP8_9ACTN|nr:transaldolase [Nonomuraea thailandensis]